MAEKVSSTIERFTDLLFIDLFIARCGQEYFTSLTTAIIIMGDTWAVDTHDHPQDVGSPSHVPP